MFELKTKSVKFELKTVGDAGEFEGFAAVYDTLDDAGDIIHRGAFSRTLHHKNGKFPILWQHQINEPLGFVTAIDDDTGLFVKGRLNLAVVRASETHALMKQALAEGIPFGLSIGYDAINPKWEGGTRHLREIRLWEVSPTLFPAQALATIAGVKQMRTKQQGTEGKPFGEYESFDACVAANQDKDDPEAFCAYLHEQITGDWPAEAASQAVQLRSIAQGLQHGVAMFKAMHVDLDHDLESRIAYVLGQFESVFDMLRWPHEDAPMEAAELVAQALAHFDQGIEALHALLALDSPSASGADPGDIPSDSEVASLVAMMQETRSAIEAIATS